MLVYATAFVLAVVVGLVLTPLSMRLAALVGAIDRPKALTVHEQATPRLGGFALGLASFVGLAVALLLGDIGEAAADGAPEGLPIAGLCVVAVWALGLIEDARPLPTKARLAIELLAGLVVGVAVVRMVPSATTAFPWQVLAVGLATVWLAGSANAMNMIDGLDGLAAGCALASGLALALIASLNGLDRAGLAGVAVAGACAGFLPWNFPRARTFMGDTGSLFLGFALATAALVAGAEGWAAGRPQVLVGCLMALGVPVADGALAMVRRRVHGRPLMQGDRSHLYDQLCWRLGMSRASVTLVCAGLSGLCGLVGLACSMLPIGPSVVVAGLFVMAVALGLVVGGFIGEDQKEAGTTDRAATAAGEEEGGSPELERTADLRPCVVRAEPHHLGPIAKLHCEALPGTFFACLGPKALTCVYNTMAASNRCAIVVAESADGELLGFVAGTTEASALIRGVIRRQWPKLLWALGPRLLSPSFVFGVLQTLTQPRSSPENASDEAAGELLSIAVSSRARRCGIGRLLVEALERNVLAPQAVSEYVVATSADDERSNAFYESLGFRLSRTYVYHGMQMNQYRKTLPLQE